jgi:hypothetical protein
VEPQRRRNLRAAAWAKGQRHVGPEADHLFTITAGSAGPVPQRGPLGVVGVTAVCSHNPKVLSAFVSQDGRADLCRHPPALASDRLPRPCQRRPGPGRNLTPNPPRRSRWPRQPARNAAGWRVPPLRTRGRRGVRRHTSISPSRLPDPLAAGPSACLLVRLSSGTCRTWAALPAARDPAPGWLRAASAAGRVAMHAARAGRGADDALVGGHGADPAERPRRLDPHQVPAAP